MNPKTKKMLSTVIKRNYLVAIIIIAVISAAFYEGVPTVAATQPSSNPAKLPTNPMPFQNHTGSETRTTTITVTTTVIINQTQTITQTYTQTTTQTNTQTITQTDTQTTTGTVPQTITETTTVPITSTIPVTTTKTKTDTLTNTVYETKPYTTTVTSTTTSPFTATQSVDFITITETTTKTLGALDTGFVAQWYIPILLIIIAILSIMVLLTIIFYRAWKNRSLEGPFLVTEQDQNKEGPSLVTEQDRSKEKPSLATEQEMVMVTCRYCGAQVDITEGSVCPRCGAKLL